MIFTARKTNFLLVLDKDTVHSIPHNHSNVMEVIFIKFTMSNCIQDNFNIFASQDIIHLLESLHFILYFSFCPSSLKMEEFNGLEYCEQ